MVVLPQAHSWNSRTWSRTLNLSCLFFVAVFQQCRSLPCSAELSGPVPTVHPGPPGEAHDRLLTSRDAAAKEVQETSSDKAQKERCAALLSVDRQSLRGGAAYNDSRASFRSDVAELSATRAKELPQLHYISHGGSTYTVLWNPAAWDSHISVWRYLRHVLTWHLSSTARVIVPVVATFTAWAALVCVVEKWIGVSLTMTMAPLTLVSSALALLLTLRTNQSLTRLLEARLAWGRAVLHARVIAGFLATRVYPINPSAAFLGGRLLCTVGWSLRASLLGTGTDTEALSGLLPKVEADWIACQRKPSLAALDRFNYLLRALAADPAYSARPLAVEPHRILLDETVNMEAVVGVCERLMSSPVPPTYTRFTSRMLVLWLACIPLALKGMKLSDLTVVLGTFFTSYIMIGIDEIAIEIEEPMRLLPLNQICNAIMFDVLSRLAPQPEMPPISVGEFHST